MTATATTDPDVVDVNGQDYPTCPKCGATGRSCKRPTGRTTAEWHAERTALLTSSTAVSSAAAVDELDPVDIPARLAAAEQLVFYRLPVDVIDPHPSNPRRAVGDVTDLAESIQTQGILEPLVVGPATAHERVVLIAGHRRLAAARIAGLTHVPCVVRRDLDTPARQLEAMLVENLHRADLSPVEEAEGYQALLEFPGFTPASVAREVGQPLSRVRDRLKLTKAPEAVKAKLHDGQITIADALATLEFAGNKSVEKTLTKALGTDDFRRELAAAREDAEHDRKVNARIQRLRDKGIKLAKTPSREDLRIDRNQYYGGLPLVHLAGVNYNDRDKVDAWVIDHHAQCPGHVTALVSEGYRGRHQLGHFCTQPNLHPRPKGPQRSPEEVKRAKADAAARKQIAGDAAVAARLRHEHLHETYLSLPATAVHSRMVALVMARLDGAMAYTAAERAHQLRALAEVFGFELPEKPGRQKVQLDDIRESVHAVVKVLTLPSLVFALDFFTHLGHEASLNNDERHGGGERSRGHDWLQILAGSYGYDPTPFEVKRFAVKSSTAVLEGHTHADEAAATPVESSWDEGRCSTCGEVVEDLGVVEGYPDECSLCAWAELDDEAVGADA